MKSEKAQTILEYTILLAIVAAALISMQVYIKRGMQGHFRENADQLGEGEFYSPGATNSTYITVSRSIEKSLSDGNDTVSTSVGSAQFNQTSSRWEEILPLDQEPRRGQK